ncbi:hypothetical protein, partial [Nocardia asiatica]|uniref:hypothetical protein n=1 Tax=Nocardia asiatica TaxID=209252 RepID=UPI002454998A
RRPGRHATPPPAAGGQRHPRPRAGPPRRLGRGRAPELVMHAFSRAAMHRRSTAHGHDDHREPPGLALAAAM